MFAEPELLGGLATLLDRLSHQRLKRRLVDLALGGGSTQTGALDFGEQHPERLQPDLVARPH